MNFDGDRPIYLQLYEEFYHLIAIGKWEPGAKIDSVRQLALDYGVNPNTLQKALQELERKNLVIADRTRGRYVTEEEALIDDIRKTSFIQACDKLVAMAKDLKMEPQTAIELVKKRWMESSKEEDHE